MGKYEGYSHCTLGAFDVVAEERNEKTYPTTAIVDKAERWLSQRLYATEGNGSIPDWNDREDQTAEAVRDRLLQEAKELRNSVNEKE